MRNTEDRTRMYKLRMLHVQDNSRIHTLDAQYARQVMHTHPLSQQVLTLTQAFLLLLA